MYDNISLDIVKKHLRNYLNYLDFEKDKDVYRAFEKSVKEEATAEEVLNNLKNLGDLKEYPNNFRNFVDARKNDLELVLKIEKEKEQLKEDIEKENQKMQEEFDKKNIDYTTDIEKENPILNEENPTYLESKKDKEQLEKDKEMLKEKNKELEKEKEVGEEFDKKLDEKPNSLYVDNSSHESEIDKIQDAAGKNKMVYNNPGIAFVENSYNYFLNNQTENSKLNVKIDYDDDQKVEVKFSYKGTAANENMPAVSFTYIGAEQMQNFYDDVYPFLIEEHVIDNNTNTFADQGHLESENSNDETLEVNGDPEEIREVNSDIDRSKESKRGVVRKLEINTPNNHAKNSSGIIIILLFAILIVSVLIIALNVVNYYK